MRRRQRTTWSVAGFVLARVAAAAVALAASNPLDERINMAVRDAPAHDTLRTFAELLSAEAVVDPAIKGTVTVELKNVRVRTLLTAVCESVGCRWDYQAGPPAKLRFTALPAAEGSQPKTALEQPIDLRVMGADGRDVLGTFAQILSAQPAVDPRVEGTVTLDLQDAPCGEALDAVCAELDCDWELAEGPPRTLKVTPKKR